MNRSGKKGNQTGFFWRYIEHRELTKVKHRYILLPIDISLPM
jgi:hypothetical protein